jgi:hypothetical protein
MGAISKMSPSPEDRERDDLLTFRYDHLMEILKEVRNDLKEIGAKAANMELRVAIIETKAMIWGIAAGILASGAVQIAVSLFSKKM